MVDSLVKIAYAADIGIAPKGDFAGLGNLSAGSLVSGLVNFFLLAAALVFFFILVMGGIRWILSQGEEAKVAAAREQVTHALIGLVIVFAAWAIVKLLESAFGIKLLNLEIPTFM